jgi:hypothetical protein
VNRSNFLFALPLLLGGCLASAAHQPTPPPEPAEVVVEPEPEPFPATEVWTAREDVALHAGDGAEISIPNLLTRLDVVGRDSVGLLVRCVVCREPVEGYVDEELVVFTHLPPEISAWSELTEFALSIRDAAERRDIDALRPVMAFDFSFSFLGSQTPEDAFAVWRSEQFATLDRLPGILDRGLASPDGRIWSAPPAFVRELGYRGLRAGFRQRVDGRWEWLYLIEGVVGDR